MPLMPLKLPYGMYKNGTPYSRKGRWTDGNLVRWHDGSVRPIGGWDRRVASLTGAAIPALIADPTLEAVRDIFAWRDLSQGQNAVFGSNLALYHMSQGGVITDITYAGYTPFNTEKDAQVEAGYGQNPYGVGSFGVANNLIGTDPVPPDRWYADNFGEVLLTGVRNNGGLYELNLGTLTLSAVSNAPTDIQALTVTDERQVFAIGGDGEPRRVQTTHREDRTAWTPTSSNEAIDRTLPGTGRLLNVVKVLDQLLIIGENDVHTAKYIGPPYVYSTALAGENCGAIAAEAVARTDRFVAWWGERNFWVYDGSVDIIPCDVIDFLYDDIDTNQVSKICAFANTDFSEIWWLYQSTSTTTTEVDSYVAWDYREQHWHTGRINRTAGIDKGVLLYNTMINADGEIYNHELEDVLPSGEGSIYVESGAIELGNGDKNIAIRAIYPDNENANDVTFEIIARQFPNDTEYTYGPYAYANPVHTRAMGRSIKMKVNFAAASSEQGTMRLDYAPVRTGRR